jgi:ribosomal protein S19E (S16A)
VAKNKNKGRIVTSKGQKLLDAAAKEVADATSK